VKTAILDRRWRVHSGNSGPPVRESIPAILGRREESPSRQKFCKCPNSDGGETKKKKRLRPRRKNHFCKCPDSDGGETKKKKSPIRAQFKGGGKNRYQ
jgi:hypothetical protein